MEAPVLGLRFYRQGGLGALDLPHQVHGMTKYQDAQLNDQLEGKTFEPPVFRARRFYDRETSRYGHLKIVRTTLQMTVRSSIGTL